jgi:pimeloyl-ACP methyl ester carboxylesterase
MKRRLLSFAALCCTSLGLLAAEEPATLDTLSGRLHGTLSLPEGTAPTAAAKPPVVLIIAGSGPTDRDGNTPLAAGRNNSLKLLAAALQAQGVATLRYDKRGIAASAAAAPGESALRFEHYVQDAAGWVRQLAADPRFAGVVVLGHSEGALIGLLAAQQAPVLGYVSLAGPAEKAADVLRRQLRAQLPPALAARNEALLAELEAGRTVAEVPPPLAGLYRASVQPYLISWFRHTPTTALARLDRPCLIVQGDTDLQVRVADAQALHQARPACTLNIVPGMNHVLKTVPADPAQQLASYGNPQLPLAPGLVQALQGFVAGLATTAPTPAR